MKNNFSLLRFALMAFCAFFALSFSALADPNIDLLDGARMGDYNKVEKALKDGADVNTKETIYGAISAMPPIFGGYSALLYAIYNNHKNIVELLLKSGADVNVNVKRQEYDSWSETVLTRGIEDVDIATLLVKHGADVNAKGYEGFTPLMYNISNNAIVELLIQNGADINSRNEDCKTPLLLACREENIKSIEILLQHKVNIYTKDKDGVTPIMGVVLNDKINAKEKKEILKKLIKNKAEIKSKSNYGYSALNYLAFSIRNINDSEGDRDSIQNEIKVLKECINISIKAGANKADLVPASPNWWYCNENGSIDQNCIDKMQITFTNGTSSHLSSITVLVKIKDKNDATLYKKKHTVAVDLDPDEKAVCKEFYLAEKVYNNNGGFGDLEGINEKEDENGETVSEKSYSIKIEVLSVK